ncbi:MAG: ComF family protein [Thermomonas sp.]
MTPSVNLKPPHEVDDRRQAPLRWLFALHCMVCGEAGQDGRDLCRACHAALPWQGPACLRCALPLPSPGTCGACLQHSPPLTETHAVFDYAFPLDRLLPRLKFHRDFASGRVLAQAMADCCGSWTRPDALVPVPLHRGRLRRRGYDQALELARPLAHALGVPLLGDVLTRPKQTSAQSRLDANARKHNLRGAFQVLAANPLPAHAVLVDDVMTTGATLHAAARALLAGGAIRVDAWVCARVA